MSAPFFITGLPKSRLAWLANLLTTDRSFCHFGALSRCKKIQELKEILASSPDGSTVVGNADPLIGCVSKEFLQTFPDSKVVFIHRPFNDCLTAELLSIRQEFGHQDQSLTLDSLIGYLRKTQSGLDDLWRSVPGNKKLWVIYSDLERPDIIHELWRFCLGDIPFRDERYRMLDFLNVSQICSKVLKAYPHQPFRQMLAANEKE